MWCLETIQAINQRLAKGRTLDEAYRDCNIRVPFPKPLRQAPVEEKVEVNEKPKMVG